MVERELLIYGRECWSDLFGEVGENGVGCMSFSRTWVVYS